MDSVRSTWQKFKELARSSLYANSAYLIAANVVNGGFGFLFWTAAARLYHADEVGLAAGAVSGMSLLVVISALGLDYAMIRFLPHEPDSTEVINTALTIGVAAALALSAAFLAGVEVWAPSLVPLRQDAFAAASFMVGTVCMVITTLLNAVFLARIRSELVFAQSAIFGATKVLLAVVLAIATAGLTALVGAWAAGTAASIAFGLLWFLRRADGPGYRLQPKVRWSAVRRMTLFAATNYLSAVLTAAPLYVMPLLVLNMLGPEANAYFYVASSISGLLVMVPTAVSMTLFAHGSQDNALTTAQIVDGILFSLGLLVPAIVTIFLLGGKILLLFGRAYSDEATQLLWLLSLATLPMTLNLAYFSVRRVQRRMADVVLGLGWILIVTLGFSVVLLPRTGLVGAGAVWLAAQASVAATYVLRYGRHWSVGHRDTFSA
jgi:O-antigen/teichoic acid export membrane protein